MNSKFKMLQHRELKKICGGQDPVLCFRNTKANPKSKAFQGKVMPLNAYNGLGIAKNNALHLEVELK